MQERLESGVIMKGANRIDLRKMFTATSQIGPDGCSIAVCSRSTFHTSICQEVPFHFRGDKQRRNSNTCLVRYKHESLKVLLQAYQLSGHDVAVTILSLNDDSSAIYL
jgi:hypothetical protein